MSISNRNEWQEIENGVTYLVQENNGTNWETVGTAASIGMALQLEGILKQKDGAREIRIVRQTQEVLVR